MQLYRKVHQCQKHPVSAAYILADLCGPSVLATPILEFQSRLQAGVLLDLTPTKTRVMWKVAEHGPSRPQVRSLVDEQHIVYSSTLVFNRHCVRSILA
jgi:hypothetical protein